MAATKKKKTAVKAPTEEHGEKVEPPIAATPPSAPEQQEPSELVPVDKEDQYRAMSARDERAVVQEIQGSAPTTLVYSFSGKTGLSAAGVREIVRTLNSRGVTSIAVAADPLPQWDEITVPAETGETADGLPVTEDQPGVSVSVYGQDTQSGGGQWGTASQPKLMRLNKKVKGKFVYRADPHARAKALSKAQRNALEPLIPLSLAEELKTAFLGRGKVEYINAPPAQAEQAPALTSVEAQDIVNDCRALYEKFKKVHPKGAAALPPGRFGVMLTASQHDLNRLDDFRNYMQEQVEAAEKEAK